MKSHVRAWICASFVAAFSPALLAGNCELKFTRTACPGQETISYKKCDGEKSCTQYAETNSAAECAKQAIAACENKRLNITKSKVINATFEGAALKTAKGSDDFCTEYALSKEEFNHCDK